jgi:hypothetical protein
MAKSHNLASNFTKSLGVALIYYLPPSLRHYQHHQWAPPAA